MNLRGGLALIRRSVTSYMASRAFFWTLAMGWMMGPLVYLFVWITAAGHGSTGGYGRDEFIVYYLALIVVNQLTYPVSNWTVGDTIRMGYFSTWLVRPLPAVFEAIATDVAAKVVCMPFTLAVVALLAVVLRPSFTLTLPALVAFVVALALALMLRFAAAYVLALTTLWSNRSDALLSLHDTLLFLLAGQVAPTALLPGVLQRVAEVLPYRYTMGFPLELLLGRLGPAEARTGFAWQAGWLVAVLLAHQLVWRRGIRRYSAVGG